MVNTLPNNISDDLMTNLVVICVESVPWVFYYGGGIGITYVQVAAPCYISIYTPHALKAN
jgi:hypothetical protein